MAVKAATDAADAGEMRAKFFPVHAHVRRGYMRENRDVVKRFLRAYTEAIRVIKTDRERTLKVFAQRTRLDDREF
jgi:ABC-type nitrate/sulfonate/bicarbonate transport system substrate-binding protein